MHVLLNLNYWTKDLSKVIFSSRAVSSRGNKIGPVCLSVCVSEFVRAMLCSTSWVQDCLVMSPLDVTPSSFTAQSLPGYDISAVNALCHFKTV